MTGKSQYLEEILFVAISLVSYSRHLVEVNIVAQIVSMQLPFKVLSNLTFYVSGFS